MAVVILPTLNEREGLSRTLGDLPFARFAEPEERIQTLVVDGGSTDGTVEVARSWDVPVMRQKGRGKGGAVVEAIASVHELGVPFVVVLDADATYPPDRILPALQLLKGGTDLVIGVRRPVWGPPSDLRDLVHRIGNTLFSYTSSLLARRSILDVCSGFWGVSTARFTELGLDDSGFAIEAELVLKSVRRGLSIHQIPVEYYERVGQAKLHAFRDGGKILATILRHGRRGPAPDSRGRSSVPLGRDLLSIGLSLGLSGAMLECASPGAPQAGRLVHSLRRGMPETQLRIELLGSEPIEWRHAPNTPLYRGQPDSPAPPAGENIAHPVARRGTVWNGAAPLLIQSERGKLTIELPTEPPWTRQIAADPAQSTSDRLRVTGSYSTSNSPSLRILTSRLNFNRTFQQATLLTANGFQVREARRTPNSPPTSTGIERAVQPHLR
jgi:hypothetical protein